ncbi:SDR family oxidoreductase [Hydrogenophaga laconesensis]|uniref:Short-subunit dehydrogenase n=1 Tax=Hydrogenophaga laconesensis TaxID=1805971 RepID=A0ABU1V8P2_9BURK|nr:SDR family oxidoreductase [Hydrogenophaga laconesensis]MDR7093598.1 short-subunit dehydrogenase [Hydrogenophaga laconesensis]
MKASQARVLLTGACGGIGQATTAALTRAGAAVLLAGRSPARLSAQVRAVQARLPDVQLDWHEVDLQQSVSIAALARHAADWQCNVVIHCAGVPEFGHFDTTAPDRIAQVLSTNLLAPMLLSQALLPHLKSLPHAQIVCVGSVLGAIGLPGYSVYSASKFGLRGFSQALRRELHDTTVRVQYLGPRGTRTAFNSSEVNDYNRATGSATDPPKAVAQALLQLLEAETAERFLGFPEKLAVRLNGLAPTLLDGAFDKHRASLPMRMKHLPHAPSHSEEMKNAH